MNFHTKYNTRFSLPLRRWNAFVSHPKLITSVPLGATFFPLSRHIECIYFDWNHAFVSSVFACELRGRHDTTCNFIIATPEPTFHVPHSYILRAIFIFHVDLYPFFWLAIAKYREISLNEMRCNWHFYGFLICSLHNGKEWKSAS